MTNVARSKRFRRSLPDKGVNDLLTQMRSLGLCSPLLSFGHLFSPTNARRVST